MLSRSRERNHAVFASIPNCHGLRLVLRLLPPSCNYSRQQASTQCCWASMAPPKPSNGTGLGKGVRSGAPGFSPSRWSCTYYRRRRLQDRINKDEMRRSKLTGQGGQSRFETLLNVLDLVYRHASVECLGSAGTAASRGGNADPAHKNNGTGLQTQTLNYQLPISGLLIQLVGTCFFCIFGQRNLFLQTAASICRIQPTLSLSAWRRGLEA